MSLLRTQTAPRFLTEPEGLCLKDHREMLGNQGPPHQVKPVRPRPKPGQLPSGWQGEPESASPAEMTSG